MIIFIDSCFLSIEKSGVIIFSRLDYLLDNSGIFLLFCNMFSFLCKAFYAVVSNFVPLFACFPCLLFFGASLFLVFVFDVSVFICFTEP